MIQSVRGLNEGETASSSISKGDHPNIESKTALSNQKYISLETYKIGGEAVKTPVWFVEDKGLIYVHTSNKTWKLKRIKRNPSVRLAASNWRGEPKGGWFQGTASLVREDEANRVLKLFNQKYGLMGRLIVLLERISGEKRIVISIKADAH